ncbi:hypothetical protein, partial [Arthrobacter sp. DR-2P]
WCATASRTGSRMPSGTWWRATPVHAPSARGRPTSSFPWSVLLPPRPFRPPRSGAARAP